MYISMTYYKLPNANQPMKNSLPAWSQGPLADWIGEEAWLVGTLDPSVPVLTIAQKGVNGFRWNICVDS